MRREYDNAVIVTYADGSKETKPASSFAKPHQTLQQREEIDYQRRMTVELDEVMD